MITKGKLKGTKVVVSLTAGKEVLQIHGHSGEVIVDALVKTFGPIMDTVTVAAPKRRGRKPKPAAAAPVAA